MMPRCPFLIIFLMSCAGMQMSSENYIDNIYAKAVKILPSGLKNVFRLDPEVTMSLPEMVNYLGYPLETHEVTTQDGYILTNHRIPHGSKGHPADPKKCPVLLIHSSYLSSDSWVYNTPKHSLGLMLADAGFDVWMINHRGNSYSKKHETLKPSQAKFWEFSIDELGNYDLSAVIDYILNKTEKQQVYLVGQSLGGGLPFILCADRPEYNAKIREIYALSPIGNAAGVRGLLPIVAKIFPPILKLLKRLGLHNLVVPNWLPKSLMGLFIKYSDFLLKTELFIVSGPSPGSWNKARNPIFSVHSNGGIAVNALLQFAQVYNSQKLRHFDWGKKKNIEKYGQPSPPDYDLKKVTARTKLYYASNDYIIGKENVDYLKKNLGNAVSLEVAGTEWNHLSYFWATNAGEFYAKIVASMVKNNAQP